MYPYGIQQWLLFFCFYCFLGWCWETAYASVKSKHFVNRGFIHGPFLPIYGSGAVMMLLVSAPFKDNLVLTYFAGVVGATLLELVTGVAMEMLFRVRYWDYSNQRFNYKGYICFTSSIAWGFFTIILTRFLHMPLERFVLGLPQAVSRWMTILLTAYIVVDFSLSFKGALSLRSILDKMEQVREELAVMERRLDALIAFSSGEFAEEKKSVGWYKKLRLEELKNGITERLESMKQSIQGSKDNVQDEVEKQRSRFQELIGKYNVTDASKGKAQRRRIFSNPTMVSKKYQTSLNELKLSLGEGKMKKHKKEDKQQD